MENISANGLTVIASAVPSFPYLVLTQWADDTDPLDLPEIEITGSAMGVNGDLVTWSSPKPLELSLSVIPGSTDDNNLNILFNLNRAGKLKPSTNDLVNLTFFYVSTSGLLTRKVALIGGRCSAYQPATGAASSGRKKSKTYKFVFENVA